VFVVSGDMCGMFICSPYSVIAGLCFLMAVSVSSTPRLPSFWSRANFFYGPVLGLFSGIYRAASKSLPDSDLLSGLKWRLLVPRLLFFSF
jgi:hypothetical protein